MTEVLVAWLLPSGIGFALGYATGDIVRRVTTWRGGRPDGHPPPTPRLDADQGS